VAWRLEAIEWEDVTCVSRFTLDQDFEGQRLYKLSVGFVIKETPEYVVLADDVDVSRRLDSPNNFGTIIPKGCIRSRRIVHGDVVAEVTQGRKGQRAGGELVRGFFERNPHVVAGAHDIGLRLGVEQSEAQCELAELERTGEVRQVMPGLWRKTRQAARKCG
jgi:hypothetical protein